MEVTRKNFKETLPLVAASIDKADFLSIDAEFTGLINGRDVTIFDSPQDYYNTLLNGSTEFLLIQYGLCAFYWDEKHEHYMSEAYTFYLFPRGRPGPEKMFLCQSSSLDFLASQGFDFNKLFKEGISYMTEPTETRLRELLKARQKLYSNSQDLINIPEENKQQVEDVCQKVRTFLDEEQSKEMEIDRCNAFVRRLLFQELGARFRNEAFFETKILENKNRVLKVTRITAEGEGKSRDTLKKEKEWEELEEAVGFSKVAQMISQSEKLVVGHNMLLDVLHTLNHFFQPLPADYTVFKEFANCMFPKLLDTKYMSSLPPFKDKVNSSVLPHLLATLSEAPFSLPKTESEEGRGYRSTDDKYHEAGYDAYVTGLCFLAMHAHLSRMRGEPARLVAPHSAALKPFINKLFLAKTAHQDSPYMNLSGADPTPSRDHVFHLTFPKEWQRNDINQLFSPFGPITVQFLNDTSALVALSRRDQCRLVSRALRGHARITLMPYARYKHSHKMSKEARDDTPSLKAVSTLETPKSSHLSSTQLPENVDLPGSNSAQSPSKPAQLDNKVLPEKVDRPDQSPDKARPGNKTQLPEKVDRPGHSSNVAWVGNKTLPEKVDRPGQSPNVAWAGNKALPEKMARPGDDIVQSDKARRRCNSASSATLSTPTRKRTSSGVFEIDEAEPPPKKTVYAPINPINTRKKHESTTNGRRKSSAEENETVKPKEGRVKGKEKVIILEKFDSGDAKPKCVNAFKESDSWD